MKRGVRDTIHGFSVFVVPHQIPPTLYHQRDYFVNFQVILASFTAGSGISYTCDRYMSSRYMN